MKGSKRTQPRVTTKRLPLPMLLSFALVAFTIEFDNEAERRIQHRTTRHAPKTGALRGPWLVSLAMYANCMRLVDERGLRVKELERRARATPNLKGMQRWRYLVVDPEDREVRATAAGLRARAIWEPLFGIIEQRWESRFGAKRVEELRAALRGLLERIGLDLPQAMPILHYGLRTGLPDAREAAARSNSDDLPLSALLARVLIAFALEFEGEFELSLAICANVLRLVDVDVRVRDLPRLSGVSKEAVEMACGFLSKHGYATMEKADGARVLHLTPEGRRARAAYPRSLASVERGWGERFGEAAVERVRSALMEIAVAPNGAPSKLLFDGMKPHPGGWRAEVAQAQTLPHYPMVLHRGGYPDGS